MLFTTEFSDICVFYAISPLHAGSGQALGAVDLPIQRERHTSWPHVQASGVKGAFRDWFQRFYLANPKTSCDDTERQASELTKTIFGREDGLDGNGGHAGAISITDAKLLAFPVRSDVAPFVWVTCPSILSRVQRDINLCGTLLNIKLPDISIQKDGCFIVTGNISDKVNVVLEDLSVSVENPPAEIAELEQIFLKLAPQIKRLLLISDENFTFLVETAVEIQPQIAINMETGTAKDGSLRYQELLPADSLLYSMVFFSDERTGSSQLKADMIRTCVKNAISTHIQMGGDMTLGRGLMEIQWITADSKEE